MSRLAPIFVAALLGASVAPAHPELEDALARINAQISAAPSDAELYLSRGELYAQHSQGTQAEANFLRAAELNPDLPRLDQVRGKLALDRREFREAVVLLTRALAREPKDIIARIYRARANRALNNHPAALADYREAFSRLPAVRPELLLEYAGVLPPADAVRQIDESIAQTGPVPALVSRALELELALGRTEAALQRLDRIATTSERKEAWLKRRGDILAAVGRTREAAAAYLAARDALATLPAWLRESPETANLSAELDRLTSHQS